MKVINACLEAIRGPHLDGDEVMVVLLELLMRRVLSEK